MLGNSWLSIGFRPYEIGAGRIYSSSGISFKRNSNIPFFTQDVKNSHSIYLLSDSRETSRLLPRAS